ncbi:MAG: hypothetical protein AAGD43_23100 [Pseudomonadota bacterium]
MTVSVSDKPACHPSFKAAAKPLRTKRSSLSPVSLRLTQDERVKLEELADGMTLSAYIRACVFAKEERRRKRRPKSVVEDKKAIAEALALLGQSRIASNLNQLAYHANIGVLVEGDETVAQITEANDHLNAIRVLLLQALGVSSSLSDTTEAENAASRSPRTRTLPSVAPSIRKRGS